MPTCPICNSRHDSVNGVAQHIFASKQGDHAQYNNKADIYQEVLTDVNPDGEESKLHDGEGGVNPGDTKDPARSAPSKGEGSGGSSGSEQSENCPKCGGELVDFRNTSSKQYNGKEVPTPDDYYCSSCGQGYNNE